MEALDFASPFDCVDVVKVLPMMVVNTLSSQLTLNG